jgi:hypothetical protein
MTTKLKFYKKNIQVKTLSATFTYSEKVAKTFSNVDYYESQSDFNKNIYNIDQLKSKLSGPRLLAVDLIIEKYKKKAKEEDIGIFRVLRGISNRAVEAIKLGYSPPKHDDLLSIISNPYILLQGYKMTRTNKGAMTPAYKIPDKEFKQLGVEEQKILIQLFNLPDSMSWKMINLISNLIKANKYPWGCSRLIFIDKPGKPDKKRPITIPPYVDKMVQYAIYMVLEAIYEPYMYNMNRSFGFRRGYGCREPMTLIKEPRLTNGLDQAIEGDIDEAYPSLDRQILLNVLKERITDSKFLQFMKRRLSLRLFDTVDKKYKDTFLGIPQGGIDSPYLWNIYLMGLDTFVKDDIGKYLDSLNIKRMRSKAPGRQDQLVKESPTNPLYQKKQRELDKTKLNFINNKDSNTLTKTEVFNCMKKIRLLKHQKRQINYFDPERKKLRFLYLRYADDFIILTNANKIVNNNIKQRISHWLMEKRRLKLSQSKTVITDMRKKDAGFLGFTLRNKPTRRLSFENNNKIVLKRTGGWQITVSPNKLRLLNKGFMKHFCDKNGFPLSVPWLSTYDAYTIIQRFNSVISGYANYYCPLINFPSQLYRWLYIVRWSCLKTLACKHHTTIKKISKIYPNYTATTKIIIPGKGEFIKQVRLTTEKEAIKKAVENSKEKIKTLSQTLLKIDKGEFPDRIETNNTPRIMDADFFERINWQNSRTQANLDFPCLVCGCPDTEMHHIHHVRKRKFSEIKLDDSVSQMQFLRNRKQVPLCTTCHDKVHAGKYTGPKLGELWDKTIVPNPTKLSDSRIIASEGYIIKGIPYEGVPLEESLLLKGWKKIK